MIADQLRPVARELLDAWWRLPRQDGVPLREDFDPTAIARILPVVSLIEWTGDIWRVRLAGTEIERRWGRALTGIDYREILAASTVAATLHEFETVCDHPCGSWSLRRLELSSGQQMTAEALRLPLRASDGRVRLILGCSGELSGLLLSGPDRPREIVDIEAHQFFDIGGGMPVSRIGPCIAA